VAALRPTARALAARGARVVVGEARFADPHTVEAAGRRLRGERIVIAAGSAPVVPAIEGRGLALTSDDLLFLPVFPRRLALVGAGAIGLELASAFADLGAAVTVVGRTPEIADAFDRDVGAYLRRCLEGRGVAFRLGATLTRLAGRPGRVTAHVRRRGRASAIAVSQVGIAVGRRFDPARVGADVLGLERTGAGLRVSPYLQTSLPHVYAAGDATGGLMLTPVAAYEGRLAARNALRGDVEAADHAVVPQTIFTTPELARVGLTHREATARGVRCHVARHDTRGASNGVATGEDGGFVKLVFDGETERLLGAQVVGYAAAELIQLAAVAIRTGATAGQLAGQLAIHPSHGERFFKAAAHDDHEVCEV
jgi:pyruvate/2-oxoglutarate dehydrogenase complex dihydrolipoamide dehydrogenase (E3) component